MSEKERMLSGKLYIAKDNELAKMNKKKNILLKEFNEILDYERRSEIIKELFGNVGKNYYIEPPLHMDYGCNTYIGNNFYANCDLIILDVAKVFIGNDVFIGPRVNIFTASHPISSKIRNLNLEYGKEIHIGNSVWIGGNTTINPGVTIGDNVVIGSGSVVTKDIPNNVIAAGNPCKVLRKITEEDELYWQSLADKYYEEKENEKC